MALTAYVPPPRGRAGCSVVLPSVDAAVAGARALLVAELNKGSGDAQADAWAAYEAVVIEASAAYHALDAVHSGAGADIVPAAQVTSEYITAVLNNREHGLTAALIALGQCERQLLTCGAPHRPPNEFATDMLAVATAVCDAMREIRAHAHEFVKPFVESERVSAHAWRNCGFQTAEAFDAYAVGRIPSGAQDYLFDAMGRTSAIHRGSALLQQGWADFGATPTGLRLGMIARYVGAGQHHAALLLYEQLMLSDRMSLLDPQLHRRLSIQLYDKPNARLFSDARVPFVPLMYSVRAHRPGAEADIEAAIMRDRTADALVAVMRRRLGEFDPGWLATRDERRDHAVPHINAFFGLSAMWYTLAEELPASLGEPDAAFAGWNTTQQSLYNCMRTLVLVRDNKQMLRVMARLLWWARYAERAGANEHEHWRWRIAREQLLADCRAFTTSSSLFGSRTWAFAPSQTCYAPEKN